MKKTRFSNEQIAADSIGTEPRSGAVETVTDSEPFAYDPKKVEEILAARFAVRRSAGTTSSSTLAAREQQRRSASQGRSE
jgi:hypothetical protein